VNWLWAPREFSQLGPFGLKRCYSPKTGSHSQRLIADCVLLHVAVASAVSALAFRLARTENVGP